MKKNDLMEITIESMGSAGEGIGKIDGYPLFVKDTFPGDRARVRLTKVKKTYAFARLVGLLLVSATVLTLTVAATGGAGTSSDPLVTLSYLNEKFLPQILSEVDKKTASREQTLSNKLTEQVKSETQAFEQKYGASSGNTSGGTAASFTVVTLNQGQILYMGVGCEAMLRTGSGVCVAASTPGLIDETSGAALAGGLALQQNHLYMATVDSRGVQASANSTKLLVRGNYSVQ